MSTIKDAIHTLGLIYLYSLLAACTSARVDNKDSLSDYKVVEIEGMTCILFKNWGSLEYYGITCNWDEYDD